MVCVAAQTSPGAAGEVPVDDDAELPPSPTPVHDPVQDADADATTPAFDPADGPALDVAQLRALRGKQLAVKRVDGRIVKGGLIDVDNDRIVLVTATGERVTLYAVVIRSWRVIEQAPRAPRPPPDGRPSATSIAVGAGAGTACGACCACAGAGYLLQGGESLYALVPLAIPLLTSGGGAAVGFMLSDDEEMPPPSIGVVMAAAVVGALIGGVVGAFPMVVPDYFLFGVVGVFLGATIGSAIAAHEVARRFAIARE